MSFRPYFAALRNGAVYLDEGTCECGFCPCSDFQCGKYLIGFLPGVGTGAGEDLLPSSLWDFSGVDYHAGWNYGTVPVAAPGH